MASSLAKITVHIVFRVKCTGIPMRKEDLPRIFQYIGGIIKGMDGIPIVVGFGLKPNPTTIFATKRNIIQKNVLKTSTNHF
jgi:hypothetical protein